MQTRRRWFVFDWFKLAAVVILAAVLLAAWLSQRQGAAPPSGGGQDQEVSLQPVFNAGESPTPTGEGQSISLQPVFSGEDADSPSATGPAATASGEGQSISLQPVFNDSAAGDPSAAQPTPVEPTATPTTEPTSTSTPTSTPEPTSLTPQTPTTTLTPTVTPTATVTPMGAVANQVDCYRATLPARLSIGQKARARVALNIRENPGVAEAITGNLQAGSGVEITGGPVCTAHGSGVFRWWVVKTADGFTGWSAEGGAAGMEYYLEPVQ